MPRGIVEFEDVEVIKETEMALLCDISGEEHWVPKGQLDTDLNEVWEEGDTGNLAVSRWWAEKRGLV
jgi:hypothetical protein